MPVTSLSLLRPVLLVAMTSWLAGCDPHIIRRPDNLEENRKFVSAPTLRYPIYACGSAVTVQNFIPGAKIDVFIDGAPAPNSSFIGALPSPGQTHETGKSFTAGMVISATQTFNGAVSASNSVTVTSHTGDFPNGLPQPRLWAHPLYECGHAVLVEDVVPNSKVTIRAEDDDGAGGFKPPVDVGGFQASPEWGLNWSGVAPQFSLKARISASAQLCTDSSPRSPDEITQTPPSPVPPGFCREAGDRRPVDRQGVGRERSAERSADARRDPVRARRGT